MIELIIFFSYDAVFKIFMFIFEIVRDFFEIYLLELLRKFCNL